MKHLVPTLSVMAFMGAVPVFGANIADDFTLKTKVQLQLRGQFGADATNSNAAGSDYNIYDGANGQNEFARFGIRRARVGIEGKNTTGWGAVLQIRGGELADGGAAAISRAAEVYYANAYKTWKTESIEHTVTGGLYKPFNNESSISSTTYLMPSDRIGAIASEVRRPGIGYLAEIMSMVRVGVDVQNGSGAGWANSEEKTGLFTSARIEFSPGAEYMIKKKMESFAGAEGTGLLIGFDFMQDSDYLSANYDTLTAAANVPYTVSSRTTFGPDVLFHWNNLTFLAEYRMRTLTMDSTRKDGVATSTDGDQKGSYFDVLIGYAVPMDAGYVIEPCFRFGKLDQDSDNSRQSTENFTPYTKGEWRAGIEDARSGQEFGLGVNFYWNGHANKTQLAYTSWTGEEPYTASTGVSTGADKAKAHVFTIQQQVTF